ncbi:MAG: pilus assembly protein TadG-related protein [Actinomycetota bacterium]
MTRLRSQAGYTAIMTAVALLFLLGAAAMAVDGSMFFQQARAEQRVADLACLAGAQELPEDPALAVEKAAGFLRPNHPALATLDPTLTAAAAPPAAGLNTYVLGAFTIEIETPANGNSTQMRVSVSQERGTHFGRAIGAGTVTINQEAYCEVGSALGGGADMPFGVLSGFTGGIINYDNNDCTLNGDNNSQCSGLAMPRHDDPNGSQFGITTSKNYIANMVSGINWRLFPPGTSFPSTQDILCPTVGTPGPGAPEPCNRVATVSGSDPSKIYNGLISGYNQYPPESEIGYLEKHHLVYDHQGDFYDSHTLEDMADCVGGCPTPEDSLSWTGPGDAPVVTITRIEDCECPRFARIPTVDNFPTANCTISDPDDPIQVNKCSARISGFEPIFLLRPYFNGLEPPDGPGPPGTPANDFFSSGQQVKFLAAVKVVFTPDVEVGGNCFSEFQQGFPKAVRLIKG